MCVECVIGAAAVCVLNVGVPCVWSENGAVCVCVECVCGYAVYVLNVGVWCVCVCMVCESVECVECLCVLSLCGVSPLQTNAAT